MSRNATAITSAVLFAVLAVLIAIVPAPFVTWTPGRAHDLLQDAPDGTVPIQVAGVETFSPKGHLLMTTVATSRVDSSVSLPQALAAYWGDWSAALPREVVYPPGKSNEQVREESQQGMTDSQSNATVAALRAAGQPVTEMVEVMSVLKAGPSHDLLLERDLISAVDDSPVKAPWDVQAAVAKHRVGDVTRFTVLRGDETIEVPITTVSSNTDKAAPSVGVVLGEGYLYSAEVSFGIDPEIVGPSAGLVFALGVYDRITPGDLTGGRTIAGTGAITASGEVEQVGAVREKLRGAHDAGAEVFVMPAANCPDLQGANAKLRVIRVTTLAQAISALETLAETGEPPKGSGCG